MSIFGQFYVDTNFCSNIELQKKKIFKFQVKFYENRANGQSKGFCCVSVASESSMRTLMDKLPKKELHGQSPVVTYATKQALNSFEAQSKTRPNPPPGGASGGPGNRSDRSGSSYRGSRPPVSSYSSGRPPLISNPPPPISDHHRSHRDPPPLPHSMRLPPPPAIPHVPPPPRPMPGLLPSQMISS